MPEAEGMKFKFDDENEIKPEFLETIEYVGKKQEISYHTDELNAVCPFSGLPDFGELYIDYIPVKKIVELKSLKYYLISFRNVGIYQEALTNRIYNDLYKLLEPEYLRIETIYNIRGGIGANCVIDSEMQD